MIKMRTLCAWVARSSDDNRSPALIMEVVNLAAGPSSTDRVWL